MLNFKPKKTMREEILKAVREKRQREKMLLNPDYDMNIRDFMASIYCSRNTNTVGTYFAPKLEYDMNGMLGRNSVKIEKGDSTILNGVNFELKFSTKHANAEPKILKSGKLGKAGIVHRICNIRPWQQFDYFILGLGDPDNDFSLRFLVFPKVILTQNPDIKLTYQNNTKKSNEENNGQPGMACSLTEEMIQTHLMKHNLLKNGTYEELITFLTTLYNRQRNLPVKQKLVKETVSASTSISKPVSVPTNKPLTNKRAKKTIVSFVVGGKTEITGKTNIEAMTNLIKHIGVDKAYGKVRKFWLAKEKSVYRTMKIGKYYYNPKTSIRDIRLNVDLLRKLGGLDIKIIETKKTTK